MSEPATVREILGVVIDCYALKNTHRTGWVKQGIRQRRNNDTGESVAEHIALMNTLAVFFVPLYNERARINDTPELDLGKILHLVAIHDVPESDPEVGDIPSDGTHDPKKKYEAERAAMVKYATRVRNPALIALWDEFEKGTTPEAVFARDLDKIEMFVQAYLYQKANPDAAEKLEQFWINDSNKIKTPVGREVLGEIMARRQELDGRKSFIGGAALATAMQSL